MGRQIRFAGTRWGRVAYASVGSGRPLVFDTGWFGDLDVMWSHDGYRSVVERLARTHEVICFDTPGSGLSERTAALTSLDDDVELLATIIDTAAVSPDRPVSLFCSSIAASTAIRFAARHPARVHRLVLYGGTLRGRDLAPEQVREALLQLVRAHWGLGSRALSDLFVPGVRGDELEWFDRWQRRAIAPETAARRLEMYYELDVTSDAAAVVTPTLVVHRNGDRAVPLAQGAAMAAAIPGANLETLDGAAHPCFLGDWGSVLDVVVPFLEAGEAREAAAPVDPPYGELTAREVDVAELAAEGLTNASIGERLGISPRTVETHLTRIREKLGVPNRAAIAAWVAQRAGVGRTTDAG